MTKKIILAVITLLLVCDISLLVVAQAQEATTGTQQQLEQLRQLQQSATSPGEQQALADIRRRQQQQQAAATQQQQRAPAPQVQQAAPPQQQAQVAVPQRRTANPTPTQQMVTGASEAIDEEAFRRMLRGQFPLTPEQIVRLHKSYEDNKYAVATTPGTPPKPVATSQMVSLAPGATPPAIRLSQGFVSSLLFLDSSGATWPITAYDLGNPGAFNIQWNKKDNTLMIQASQAYTYGNLAVRLQGLTTPVMLTLVPGQKVVDYRVDLRVQGLGPNASALPLQGLPGVETPLLLGVLEGVPPPGSQLLTISGGAAEVWGKGDKLYLRTRLSVLSPSWVATVSSADGMRAYEMQKTPLILASQHGKVVQLKISGL